MCNPIAFAVVMAATTAAQVYSEREQGKAQAEMLNQQHHKQVEQINDQAEAEASERARAARRERARIRVSASESGVNLASGSIENLMLDSLFQQNNDITGISANADAAHEASETETRSRLSMIQLPTALGAALRIGASAMSGYAMGGGFAASGTQAAGTAGSSGSIIV